MRGEAYQRIGDYEILGTLGAGGMGRVYRVRHVISDRIEAMKILLPDLAGRKELADRFLREIKLVASLNHPNIASLCTALTIDNQLIMVMEFVEGVTLTQLLDSGPLPIPEALNYLDQALAALGYAHQKRIIHRDIKPANIMLTPSGVVKLMDFGIARVGTERALTQTGTTLGSLDYMSPEQIMGQPVDARSDLYSMGVSFYEMVTGQRPFKADSDFELMAAHVKEAPRPPVELQPWLPIALNEMIVKSIAKAPQDRFQSAEELREALRTVQGFGTNFDRRVVIPAATMDAPPPPRSSTRVEAWNDNRSMTVVESHRSPTVVDHGPGARAMTQVVSPQVYNPPQPAALVVQRKSFAQRPAVYLTCGGLLAAGIGVGAVSLRAKPKIAGPEATLTTTSAVTPVPIAVPPAVVRPRITPAQPHLAVTATAKAPPPPPVDAPPKTAGPPPESAQTKAQLDELEPKIDDLESRAVAVNNSLNNMQRSMQQSGMALRGDMVARQASMNNNLGKTKQAFAQKDADRATRFAGLTESDVAQLEKFLGR